MTLGCRRVSRMLGAAITVAWIVAGCGGTTDDAVSTAPALSSTSAEPGGELAGVHFDVRRDPG